MSAAELLAELRTRGCRVWSDSGTLRCEPAPPAARAAMTQILALLTERASGGTPLAEVIPDADHAKVALGEAYDPTRDAVRIEYEDDESTVGFWIVPDTFTAATYDGEPALRRCDLGPLLQKGDGAQLRALVVLRAFPGVRVRAANWSAGAAR